VPPKYGWWLDLYVETCSDGLDDEETTMVNDQIEALLGGTEEGGPRAWARAELDLILASQQFRNCAKVSKVLRYITEAFIKGYVVGETEIGIAIYRPDYDPDDHSNVRVAVGEIREKLARYYCESGSGNPYRLMFAAKGYAVTCTQPPTEELMREQLRKLDLLVADALVERRALEEKLGLVVRAAVTNG